MKVKIIKDTWAHSKRCWYIVDVTNGYKFNYTGYTSKKVAMWIVEGSGDMELV